MLSYFTGAIFETALPSGCRRGATCLGRTRCREMVGMSYLWRLLTQACCRVRNGNNRNIIKGFACADTALAVAKLVVVHVPFFCSFYY